MFRFHLRRSTENRKDACKIIAQQRPGRLSWNFRVSLFDLNLFQTVIYLFFHKPLPIFSLCSCQPTSPSSSLPTFSRAAGMHRFDLGCTITNTAKLIGTDHILGELWALQLVMLRPQYPGLRLGFDGLRLQNFEAQALGRILTRPRPEPRLCLFFFFLKLNIRNVMYIVYRKKIN